MSSVAQRRPCEYLKVCGDPHTFTIVYTPHFLDRQEQRQQTDKPNVLAGLNFVDLLSLCVFLTQEHRSVAHYDYNLR